jgi:RNA polymerase sigma-70 factor (ECF subfamily)
MPVASRLSAAASEPPHSPPDCTDLEAIHAVEHGNREMFEVIVRRYNPRLYRVGMAYLQDHALSEDAMQNAYLKAFLNLHRFRRSSTFGTWLTRIMINECLMILRSKKRITMHSLDDGETPLDEDRLAAPAPDSLHAQDIRAVIEKALQALPRTHRAVYLLREVQQLSTEETAQSLGLSRENVKVSLHRAREGLKTQVLKSAAGAELFDYPARYCDPLTARVMQAVHATPRS